jgi:hypothetical protein
MSKVYIEKTHSLVISRPERRHVIYVEWLAHFWFKVRKIRLRFRGVWWLHLGRRRKYDREVGFEGLQIRNVRLYYDRSMLTPFFEE